MTILMDIEDLLFFYENYVWKIVLFEFNGNYVWKKLEVLLELLWFHIVNVVSSDDYFLNNYTSGQLVIYIFILL